MLLGKLDISIQKMETGPMSFTVESINSMWTQDLNIGPETLKVVKEREENTLELISIGINFLNKTKMAHH
jgi:hypothetical protein